MFLYYIPITLLLAAGMLFSVKARKLTVAGAVTGGLIGLFVFLGANYTGIAMMTAFFILGTAATSFKIKTKETIGAAEKNKGRRTAGQVIANAGVAGLIGVFVWLHMGNTNIHLVMIAASLASAAADTLSSELGMLYGSRFYNILTLKKDVKGLDGVVSLEGTLIGILGSAVIACIYAIGFGWSYTFWIIIIAGTVGNISDSILGATLERRLVLNNNAVNFLNTFIAALTAALLYTVW